MSLVFEFAQHPKGGVFMPVRYIQSELFLQEAFELFSTGTQMTMESAVSFPGGISPLFVQKVDCSRIWDANGNECVDFVGVLGPSTPGN